MRSHRKDSFKTFEANTSDAWDDGDDDLMKLASSARQRLSENSVCGDGLRLSAGSDESTNVNSSELSAPFVGSSGMDQKL